MNIGEQIYMSRELVLVVLESLGFATVAELAEETGVAEDIVERILVYETTRHEDGELNGLPKVGDAEWRLLLREALGPCDYWVERYGQNAQGETRYRVRGHLPKSYYKDAYFAGQETTVVRVAKAVGDAIAEAEAGEE